MDDLSLINLKTIAKCLNYDVSIDSLLFDYDHVDDAQRVKRSEDSFDAIDALIPILQELSKHRPLPSQLWK